MLRQFQQTDAVKKSVEIKKTEHDKSCKTIQKIKWKTKQLVIWPANQMINSIQKEKKRFHKFRGTITSFEM